MAGRGAQLLLDGAAQAAARGAAGSSVFANTDALRVLQLAGLVGDGNSQDGSSSTGLAAEDVLLSGPQAWNLPTGTTAQRPTTGDIGQMRYNTDLGQYEFGFGGSWGSIATVGGTGAMLVPIGTTAQRPNTGDVGSIRYNTTTGRYEYGTGGAWRNYVRLDGDTMTGNLNASAITASGLLAGTAGISFNGGSVQVSGRIGVNSSFGGWMQGRAGTSADLVLADNGGNGIFRIMPASASLGSYVNIGKGLAIRNATGTGPQAVVMADPYLQQPPGVPFYVACDYSGVTTAPGLKAMGLFNLNSDTVDASGAAGTIASLGIIHQVDAGFKGDRNGIYNLLQQNGASAQPDGSSYVGWGGGTIVTTNDGGTGVNQTDSRSQIWGFTLGSIVKSGATYFRAQTGIEIDIATEPAAGTGPLTRIGAYVVLYPGSKSRGFSADAAWAVASSNTNVTDNATSNFKAGFSIGYNISMQPIADDGVAFLIDACNANNWTGRTLAQTSNRLGWFADGINGDYTAGLLRMPGYRLFADKRMTVGSAMLSDNGTAVALDTVWYQGPAEGATFTGGAIIAAGTNIIAGMRGTDAYGGVYGVSGASAGAATTVFCYRQPSDGTDRSGTVTINMDNSALSHGAGAVIQVTQIWTRVTVLSLGTTAATVVNIGRSGQSLGFYGATATAKPTGVAVTAAGIHAALVSLGLIAA